MHDVLAIITLTLSAFTVSSLVSVVFPFLIGFIVPAMCGIGFFIEIKDTFPKLPHLFRYN